MTHSAESVVVEMRDLHGQTRPLKVAQGHDPYMVEVPGFGMLVVGQMSDQALIVRLAQRWSALLVQPDREGRFSPQSNKAPREVRVTSTGVEVELLPNPSGEDRLVVVLRLNDGGDVVA